MKEWAIKLLTSIATGLLAKIFIPVILALPPVAGLIIYLQNGEWEIPVWAWWVSGLLLAMIGISWIIVKRARSLEEENFSTTLFAVVRPARAWTDVGSEEHFGVNWRVRYAKNLFSRGISEETAESSISKIDVQSPPLCPKCDTELYEKSDFWGTALWGKYVWYCVGCGFKKRSKEKFYKTVDKVKRIVRGQARRELTNQLRDTN
ncbi:hypothetical protein T458_18865 [Brevibacillus panacihumi W25]|uniref:Uncharacterized protein n=1 Tax=Brevibacillus panacihumi W25 TaxID=1408254 RepID=V6MEQ1_9BACL|nr:hypothetical protein [Brevibacillus panacihumi]EST53863.1 hypothetical protein T458_18865 [Brevibacillus panacihumi W25]